MADRAIRICNAALSNGMHPGYSDWFVRDMITYQLNVLATIQREQPNGDHGLAYQQRVLEIRCANMRPENASDAFWVASAEGNLAVSLMDCGHVTESIEILENLQRKDGLRINADIYTANLGLAHALLGDFRAALKFTSEAKIIVFSDLERSTEQSARVAR